MANPSDVPANFDDAVSAYQSGKSLKECATILGVSRTTARNLMSSAGIAIRVRSTVSDSVIEDAIAAYRNGATVVECARMCGLGHETFRQRLIKREIPLRGRLAGATARRIPTPPGLVEAFLGGESVKALAARHGFERSAVYRMLKEAGIDGRNRSEAMQVRWQRATDQERHRMLDAAHDSTRGVPIPIEKKIASAAGNAGKPRSVNETTLGQMLAGMGYGIAYGTPVGPYNADLVVSGTVAVEVNGGQWHEAGRHRERFAERSRHILDAGYSLAIVWADSRRYPLGVECAKHLATLVEITRGHPSIGRQHWVIRGDGHFLSVREDDGDKVPFITSSGRRDG